MKIELPDSWDEVTLGDYQEFAQAQNDIERISILADQDPEDIKKLDAPSVGKILNHLSWVKKLPDQNRYKLFIEIDEVEYRLVHNLNGFSLGEWVDMDEYQKEPEKNLHLILAMLYRPEGEYRSEDVRPRAELFQDKAMIGHLYGALLFFSHVVTKSTPNIQRYLILSMIQKMKRQRREKKESQKKEPLKNGAGITMPTV